MAHSILLLEDDRDIAEPLVFALRREGNEVIWVRTCADALTRLRTSPPAMLIADRGLPDGDGLEVVAAVRSEGYSGAILVLSARGAEMDRVQGLDIGADDYQPKPFTLAELLARVRAGLRRADAQEPSPDAPAPQKIVVDEIGHRAFAGDTELDLTPKEFDVLAMLAKSVDVVVRREELMAGVWGKDWFGSTKALDVTVARLRQKLDAASALSRIVAVRGIGFRLE